MVSLYKPDNSASRLPTEVAASDHTFTVPTLEPVARNLELGETSMEKTWNKKEPKKHV